MPRQIDKIRKLSCREMAVLLEEVAGMNVGEYDCPICVGCEKAKKHGWDCTKAREEFLKGKLEDERF